MADKTSKTSKAGKTDAPDEGMQHALEAISTGDAGTTEKAQSDARHVILDTRNEVRAGIEAELRGERTAGIGRQRSAAALMHAVESGVLKLATGGETRTVTVDMVSNAWCQWSNLPQGGPNTQRVDADQATELLKFIVETFHPAPAIGDPKKPTDKERDALNMHRKNGARVKAAFKLAACLFYTGYGSVAYSANVGFSIAAEDFAEKGVTIVHPKPEQRLTMNGRTLILCLDARKSADNPTRPEIRPTVEQLLKANKGPSDNGTERNTIKSLADALDFVAANVKPDTEFTEDTTKAKARAAFLALLPHFMSDAAKATGGKVDNNKASDKAA